MNPWEQFQDIVGPREEWPSYIIDAFWCSDLDYKSRMLVVCFTYSNGATFDQLDNCLSFINKSYTLFRKYEIKNLFKYFEGEGEEFYDRRSRYTAYNIVRKRVLDLNFHINNYSADISNYNPYRPVRQFVAGSSLLIFKPGTGRGHKYC